ncbi:MAG: hypothetical protein ACXABY_14890 [Candidatus Thorarchaeota archaeon]|jgi:hypothetical protein
MPGAQYDTNIAGPVLIKFSTFSRETSTEGDESNLIILGYSQDGCRLSWQQFERMVFGDQNGGQEGPPVDVIIHGEMCEVSFLLNDYTKAVLEKLRYTYTMEIEGDAGAPLSAKPGLPPNAGTLLIAKYRSIRLLLEAPNHVVNFPTAYWTNPYDFNMSTNETQNSMVFRALRPGIGVQDVLWDDSVTDNGPGP